MPVITGNMLVDVFRQYEYVGYAWGGASPDTGWDCSGACNWIIGYKFHLAIPGFMPGTYGPGAGHGPVVADWIQWIGATRGGFPGVQPMPGDLIAWGPNAHMGMAINSQRFVSAANPSQGTIEADINGFFSYNPYVLRLLQIRIGATTPAGLPLPPATPRGAMTDWSRAVQETAIHAARSAASLHGYAAAIRRT